MTGGRRAMIAVIGLSAVAAILAAANGEAASAPSPQVAATGAQASPLVAEGRRLFVQGCSDCHGFDASGIDGIAPDLRGAGALSADFYLRTGRMPMDDPREEPVRSEPAYDRDEIAALVAYVASLGGPDVPAVDTSGADLAHGRDLFDENCAGCHQVVAQGGIMPGAVAPDLQQSSPTDVAEAIAIGPFVMPSFPHLDGRDTADLAAYVESTKDPEDRGGWGIGHIGPIPEGMVAWLLAGAALLIAIRLIGERRSR